MRTRGLIAAAVLLALSACGRGAGSIAAAATVNGRPVQESILEVLLNAETRDLHPKPSPSEYPLVEETQRKVLTQLIQDEIVAQSAAELEIVVTKEQVQQRFLEIAEQFGGVDAFRAEIARRGRTEQDVREQIASIVRSEVLSEHFVRQVNVSDAEVRAAYEREKDSAHRVVDAAHILVETREEAEEILTLLRGGADFAVLARERSQDPTTSTTGGALGEFTRGQFVPEFESAVWSAQPGQLIGPVQTRFGWHVVKVNAFRTVPFEEVRDELRRDLERSAAQRAFDEWYQGALLNADVDVDPRFGDWDSQSGQVVASSPLAPANQIPAGEVGSPAPDVSPAG